jgi:hypothetical protein
MGNQPVRCGLRIVRRESLQEEISDIYDSIDEDQGAIVEIQKQARLAPMAGKDGDEYPLGRTYVLKAGPEVTDPFNARPSGSTGSVIGIEQAIEEGLKETLDLCTRDVQGDAPAQSPADSEDEGSFPIPEETNPSESSPGRIDWNDTEGTAMRVYRQIN